ncbi:MAG: NAD(P)-binding domain-containing protein [Alphaproteobacteria bacterium]|nr:NAD(P)-binding domain-containing protein [Alphaproteobacteria bacterium]
MTIGFLGVGDMATYMVEGLCRDRRGDDIVLSPRNAGRAQALADAFGCRVAASNRDVVEAADVVILAVRPADVTAVVAGLPWRQDQSLISVGAGATLADLAAAAPADIVRSMPVSCAAIGESPTAIYPDHAAAHDLFRRLGTVIVLPDEASFGAASVMGAFHGWTYGVIKAATDWVVAQNVPPEQARELVAGMMRGAAGVALAFPETPLDETLERLTTPGGITEAGFRRMAEERGLKAWPEACAAALRHMGA